jgi:ribosomal protein L17
MEWWNYSLKGTSLGEEEGAAIRARLPALQRYEDAFDKVLAEIESVKVTGRPAVWFIYNMGFVVKTAKSLFAIDLHHRRAEMLAPKLDFALITHNHGDHYTERFYKAMDGREKKTVVSNFADNYGARYGGRHPGGYTRAVKTFEFGDVKVRTTLTDHNDYLIDYTTAFEVTIGDFVIYHSGDCSNAKKLKPLCPNPDLWMFHPWSCMKPLDGARAVNPKLAVVAHLNELGHAKDRWRFTWAEGEGVRQDLEKAGFKAIVPIWGDRIV